MFDDVWRFFVCFCASVFHAFSGRFLKSVQHNSLFFWFRAKTADRRKMQHLPHENQFFKVRPPARAAGKTKKTIQEFIQKQLPQILKNNVFLLFSCRKALLLKSLPKSPKRASRRASSGLPGPPGGLKSINFPSPRILLGAPKSALERSRRPPWAPPAAPEGPGSLQEFIFEPF